MKLSGGKLIMFLLTISHFIVSIF